MIILSNDTIENDMTSVELTNTSMQSLESADAYRCDRGREFSNPDFNEMKKE